MLIKPLPVATAKRQQRLTPKDALIYDYSMQFFGNKQDIVSSFIKKDHKKLWLLLEKAYLSNQKAIRLHRDIKLLGYAASPKHEDYLFAFVEYTDEQKQKQRRTFVLTFEENKMKRTFSFAVEEKEIFRIVNKGFESGGEDFKGFRMKDGKVVEPIVHLYPREGSGK